MAPIILVTLVIWPSFAFGDVVVARRTIPAGEMVLSEAVIIAPGEVEGAAQRLSEVIGMEAAEAIYPGHPVALSVLRSAALFERNERVEMRYRKGPLVILTEGRALAPGRMGSRIPVLNLGSKMTVVGRVMPDGSIEVSQ